MKQVFSYLLGGLMLLAPTVGAAQTQKPDIKEVVFEGGGTFYALSSNGKWACGNAVNANNSSLYGYATLVNAVTGEQTHLWPEDNEFVVCSARDVSDNGDVVGYYNAKAAIYWREKGEWQVLPQPAGQYIDVELVSITPDGRFAVGSGVTSAWTTYSVAYEFGDDGSVTMLELKNIDPVEDRFEVVLPGGLVPVSKGLYNLKTQEVITVPGGTSRFFSSNGRYMVTGAPGDDDWVVYGPFNVMDMETKKVTPLEDNSPANNIFLADMDDNGVVYGMSESDLMFRNWHVHVGKYWYDIRVVLQQLYGIDWVNEYAKTDRGLSGTFWGVDSEGKVAISIDYTKSPETGYIFRMPESFSDICPRVNLLSNNYATPMNGASFSRLSNVSITFDRPVETLIAAEKIGVTDKDGNVLTNAIRFDVSPANPNQIEVSFRNYTLEDGQEYFVVIPAGAIGVKGDNERTNSEIRLQYKGRPNTPVKPLTISPAEGNEVPRINMSSNPVFVNFDTNLTVCENPNNEYRIKLFRKGENGDEQVAPLSAQVNGSTVRIYPVNEQRLAEGDDYKVVIAAGTFADLSGANPNEEIVINYKGSYTPDLPTDDKVIFSDNFNNGLNTQLWMFHEGDGNTPNSTMASWSFTADTTPWWLVRDSNASTDYAACSHSMYTPAGQSDDWMVTQRMYVADDTYTLSFKSQSYLKGKEDRLKVYVLASNDVITSLTPSIVNKIRYDGKLIYNEVESPGEKEETMAGEWKENELSLAEFAGQNIYIAFVNDNTNQSAIFLDDVEVARDLKIAMQLFNPEYTIDKESVAVSGRLQNLSNVTYNDLKLSLIDEDGNVVDEINATGLNLAPKGLYPFTFAKELPLRSGLENNFRVELSGDDVTTSAGSSVKNLLFQTTKRVVLEENTGTSCQFCPQGHVVMEKLEAEFGDRFVPIAIHGYTGGSTFATSESQSYSTFLGLSAAPSAVIDRTYAAMPMGEGYHMITPEGGLWYDLVTSQMNKYADADITVSSSGVDETESNVVVNATVKYAYNAKNLNVNILTAVLEDKLPSAQTNAFVNSDAEEMADWRAGGKYGTNPAAYIYTNVFRGLDGNTLYNGVGGKIPSEVEAGKSYNFNITMPIPQAVSKPQNMKYVVLMIDANSGRVINAVTCKNSGVVGVDGIEADNNAADARGDVYSITGVCVLRDATMQDVNRLERGIYIFNGKKIAVR